MHPQSLLNDFEGVIDNTWNLFAPNLYWEEGTPIETGVALAG